MVFLMIFMYNIKVARSVVKMNDKIYIFGHKNPDTDTVCSAISLATIALLDKVKKRCYNLIESTDFSR